MAKKASRTVPVEKRFQSLYDYCTEKGNFLADILSGKVYLKHRKNWLNKLLEIPSITCELGKKLDFMNDEEKRASRTIPIEKKFQILCDYCEKEKKLFLLQLKNIRVFVWEVFLFIFFTENYIFHIATNG